MTTEVDVVVPPEIAASHLAGADGHMHTVMVDADGRRHVLLPAADAQRMIYSSTDWMLPNQELAKRLGAPAKPTAGVSIAALMQPRESLLSPASVMALCARLRGGTGW